MIAIGWRIYVSYSRNVIIYSTLSCVLKTSFRKEVIVPGSICLDAFRVDLAQSHVDVRARSHDVVLGRPILRHASWRRDQGYVVVASEEERDRISIFQGRLDSVRGRYKDIVWQYKLSVRQT